MQKNLNHAEAVVGRHIARQYKPRRLRRLRNKEIQKGPPACLARKKMEGNRTIEPEEEEDTDILIERTSLGLPNYSEEALRHPLDPRYDHSILQAGDPGFKDSLRQYVPSAESNANEKLVALKSQLRAANTHDFWALLLEGICDIAGAQSATVSKRILVDDQDSAVEMPEYGQPGSCLLALAILMKVGEFNHVLRDYRYHVVGTGCYHMRHNKVILAPERMLEVVPDHADHPAPWKVESWLAVPLFAEGKNIGHFQMIFNSEGAARRTLSWTFLEMLMHSLEDMAVQRILEGRGFAKETAAPESTLAKVIPLAAISATQSLKPYARSLSHELRTPMQGVIGMLDIMYATVLEAISEQQGSNAREVFKELKFNIEVVQDSSRRAVEAADNVVRAYDVNMQMPDAPPTPGDPSPGQPTTTLASQSEGETGFKWPVSKKHGRTEDDDFGPTVKRVCLAEDETMAAQSVGSSEVTAGIASTMLTEDTMPMNKLPELDAGNSVPEPRSTGIRMPVAMLSPNRRHVVTRDFIQALVADSVLSSNPSSEHRSQTVSGEVMELQTRGSKGETLVRTIHLSIADDVPEVVVTEEQPLRFAVQKLIDNAIKFTESGSINISVKLSRDSQMVEILVADTGCGIAEESVSSLFKPHFQEDATRSRTRDGLGLSLFNAKAHVRRNLSGDVTLERSATHGPSKGSEFLIRIPITSGVRGREGTPIVGSPSGQPSYPTGVSSNPNTSTEYFPPGPTHSSAGTSSKQKSPVKKFAVTRTTFNRSLARDYPLNILIAEDNPINRSVAIGCLKKLGYSEANMTLAFDGLEAVQKYAESLSRPREQQFDAIFMDVWMPNMDGYQASEKILQLARDNGLTTTILAVTADITGDCIKRADEVGMGGFLNKPYKVLDIENLILEHFGKEVEIELLE